MAARPLDGRNTWLPVLGSLVVLAWLTLAIWSRSPYGRYLDHGGWIETGLTAELCRALPAGAVLLPALLYVGGWLLMTVAMMLPTTLPLLTLFARITQGRADRGVLLALLIAGYLGAWTGFGLIAHGADLAVQAIVAASPLLAFNGWIIGALVLMLAGAFQFSALKYRCLDKCRTPFSFINEHWRGSAVRRQALLLGLHHGLFCVGCCWAIMLLMFVVGTGSLGWMLLIGAVMAVEKNVSWGRWVSVPLGIALLACAAAVVVINL